MLNPTLHSAVDRLWDKFWSGGISNPLTAIEQISYLLFIKQLDEMDLKKKQDAEFIGEKYEPFFKKNEEKFRWSYFKQMEGGEMLQHIQEKVFPFVKNLGKRDGPFVKYMANAVFIISKPSLLVEAINIIDGIYDEISREQAEGQNLEDTQGDLYEHLLSEVTSAGKLGQFRTPRHIIQLICELVKPQLGDTICDPACGTGGFLLGAYQHILTHYTSDKHLQKGVSGLMHGLVGDKLTDKRQWQHLKEKTFHGYDVDETMVRICVMNLMMHGISNPNIFQRDSLSKNYSEDNAYDVIMANPPFKGSLDKGDISDTLMLPTTKTELLFINRIINSLKIGGRAAMIVPDGVLFGSSNAHKLARKMLIEQCELQGVISMPSGVFKPYAGVSTAILVFVKGGETERVWFYDMEADGLSLDDKRDKTVANDIPDIIAQWSKRHDMKQGSRKGKCFWVERKKIEEHKYDLSVNRYREVQHEAAVYEKPEVILGKIEQLETQISAGISDLKHAIK